MSCDLGQAVTQLAFLRCYDGVVELPLRKAAAVDPDNTARLPGDAGRAGREASLVCHHRSSHLSKSGLMTGKSSLQCSSKIFILQSM